MRALFELAIILGIVTGFMLYAMKRYVQPWLTRKHIDQIERDNLRLDRLLDEVTRKRQERQ